MRSFRGTAAFSSRTRSGRRQLDIASTRTRRPLRRRVSSTHSREWPASSRSWFSKFGGGGILGLVADASTTRPAFLKFFRDGSTSSARAASRRRDHRAGPVFRRMLQPRFQRSALPRLSGWVKHPARGGCLSKICAYSSRCRRPRRSARKPRFLQCPISVIIARLVVCGNQQPCRFIHATRPKKSPRI